LRVVVVGVGVGFSVKEEDEGAEDMLEVEKKMDTRATPATTGWDGLEMDMDMD